MRERCTGWVAGVGWGLSAAGALLYLAEGSPVAALFDPRQEALAAGAAGSALLAAALWMTGWSDMAPLKLGMRLAGLGAAVVVAASAAGLVAATRHEEVRFAHGDVALAGTLYLPRAAGPHPAVVVLHGSGRESRREYAMYARFLARRGIAGLAYDKRGVGASTGDLRGADYGALAGDAAAAIEYLRSRREIDRARVGIFGVSEGEWTGLLAARMTGAAFLAVASPSARTPAEQVLHELRTDLRAAGFGEEAVASAAALQERLDAYARTGEGREALGADLRRASAESWFGISGLPAEPGDPGEWSWWRSVMDFDPLPLWREVRCPVLVVSGALDRKSPVAESQERIREALRAGGNSSFSGRIYPRAGHAIVEWWLPGGLPPPRFPDGYPEFLAEWVREQAGALAHAQPATGAPRPGGRCPA